MLDECDLCNGNIIECEELDSNTIYLNSDGGLWYNLNEDIYGFQFDVVGVEVTDTFGGDAEEAGFDVYTNSTEEISRIMGFSINGNSISQGCGKLLNLIYEGTPTEINNIIFAGINGSTIEVNYFCQE